MIQIPENLKTNPVGKYLNMKPTKDKETLAMAMTKRKTSTHFQQFKNKIKQVSSYNNFGTANALFQKKNSDDPADSGEGGISPIAKRR